MPNINLFPEYFQQYTWQKKHHLYGYPPDNYRDFAWICSLEQRFNWLKQNIDKKNTASIYLIREMIQWGGSQGQGGVLQKFEDGLGEVNLQSSIAEVIRQLNNPRKAIEAALVIPGMGLTYASKMLRFFDPDNYGALDSRVRGALKNRAPDSNIPTIIDGNVNSMINGYEAFIYYLETLRQQLDTKNIVRPACAMPIGSATKTGWRLADIEMALFTWADTDKI